MSRTRQARQRRVPASPDAWRWLAIAFAVACGGTITSADRATPDVADVVIAPLTANVIVGNSLMLQATIHDASGEVVTGPSVVWSTRDTAVATVSPTGLVTARGVGSTQVAASVNGKSGLASVTVTPPPVASVTVTPARVDLTPGASASLAALTYDASGRPLDGRVVVWASSNTAVAKVDASGAVTAVAAGTATITATSEGVSGTSSVSVAVPVIASVALDPRSATLQRGGTVQLTATITDATGAAVTDRPPTWTSTNSAVAIVSASGLVTAVASGSASIAAALDGKADTMNVTVVAVPVGSISVLPTSAKLSVGQSATLTPTVKDVTGTIVTDRPVTWTTSNAAVASVTKAGVVTAVRMGTASITATSEGKSASAAVTVTTGPVDRILLSPTSIDNLRAGRSATLSATAVDVNGDTISGAVFTWHSGNTYVATVSSDGRVTGAHSGTTTITATFSGKTGSASVRVR